MNRENFWFTNIIGNSCTAIRTGGNYKIYNEGTYACTLTQCEVEDYLSKGTWTLIEEENKDVMEIPVKFTMGLQEDQIPLYVLTLQEGGMYSCVSTKDDKYSFGPYNLNTVEGWLNGKVFTIVEDLSDESNGTDADDKPKNFSKEDLKPFMRVVLENGYEYIVVPDGDDLVGATVNGWMNLIFTEAEADSRDVGYDWLVSEVYASPSSSPIDMLDEACRGELLWKRRETKEEEDVANQLAVNPFQERIDYFEVSIQALQDELEALKQDMGT